MIAANSVAPFLGFVAYSPATKYDGIMIKCQSSLLGVRRPFGEAPMISSHTTHVAELAKAIYAQRLQAELEAAQPNGYVAIEPESGEHFLADSFSRAVAAARAVHPD